MSGKSMHERKVTRKVCFYNSSIEETRTEGHAGTLAPRSLKMENDSNDKERTAESNTTEMVAPAVKVSVV